MFRYALLFLAVCLATSSALYAAQAPSAADDFAEKYSQWKAELAKFAEIRARYQTDTSADKEALQADAKRTMDNAREMMEPLTLAGARAYVAAPNQDEELTRFLLGAVNGYVMGDDFEVAAKIARVLLRHKCDAPQLDYLAGIAFFATNDFDAAQQRLQAAKDKKVINKQGLQYLSMIDQYRTLWASESALRSAEAAAKDLPRVKLETAHGDIIVELFENEAPNTTANFISLVERGFYNGLDFHRVIPGFMAQGGDPNGDGSGGPGYTIHDECRQENHRKHFRGSLSMAKTAAPDTGGSQFFITFVPTSHLDGKHTVFGRVVEGIRVLRKLQRTEGTPGVPGAPDKITKATVLSKRPHDYKPVTREN